MLLGILASSTLAIEGDYESIATVTVGAGGAGTIDFTSIATTWNNLQIRAMARTDRNDGAVQDIVTLTFNGDTASNYSDHYLFGDGAAAYSDGTANRASIRNYYVTTAQSTSNRFGALIIDIVDYKNTNKNKTTRTFSGADQNGSGNVSFTSGSWRNTNAITSIQLKPLGGSNFVQYSHFALYGIKSA